MLRTHKAFLAMLAVAVLAFAGAALAQEQVGSLEGIVSDDTGQALPGVTVEANEAKGVAWQQRPPQPFTGPIVVDVVFCFAIPKSRRKGKDKVVAGDPQSSLLRYGLPAGVGAALTALLMLSAAD